MGQSGESRTDEASQSHVHPARPTAQDAAHDADRMFDLVHELDVHRNELALQSEELEQMRLELAAARDAFFEVYELSPVAYVTLDRTGTIERANFAACAARWWATRTLSQRWIWAVKYMISIVIGQSS